VGLLRYLHSCRPESLAEAAGGGYRVLHFCVYETSTAAMMRAVYELDPSAARAVTDAGFTPLRYLVHRSFKGEAAPSAEAVEKLRFLAHKHPEAVSTKGEDGQTAYALCHPSHEFARRLLLSAAPSLDKEALVRFNYSARRSALFLFFVGCRKDGKLSLFAKLSQSPNSQNVVHKIVAYL